MGLKYSLGYIYNHPLASKERFKAFLRYGRFHLATRFLDLPVVIDFVDDTRLMVRRGMAGGTTNYFVHLCDFEEMVFLIHFLRDEDLFVDVGANIGAYSLLAGSVAGAQTIAVEPDSEAFEWLRRNIGMNGPAAKYSLYACALGEQEGEICLSSGRDTMNRILRDGQEGAVRVQMKTLAQLCQDRIPALVKIDVEGYEKFVLAGAESLLADQRLVAIILELNDAGREYGVSDAEVHQLMLEYDFVPVAYDPGVRALTELTTWRRDQNNTIYCRSIDFVRARLKGARRVKLGSREW